MAGQRLQSNRLDSGSRLVICLAMMACSPEATDPVAAPEPEPPAILLITLDTTRADRLGIGSDEVETPVLAALASTGVQFVQAYSTAPMTLPAHTSMFTGLYPADHGIRENGRHVDEGLVLLASLLRKSDYTTAAFVSGFPLAAQFGLARGFDHYDDDFGPEQAERAAGRTTDRVLAYLQGSTIEPLFLWVHYFDPHEPYDPPEPFRSRYQTRPYLGEIAYMDRELGRLLESFEERFRGGATRVIVVGDHGEGLGDHGETLHGNLLYQGVMRVPLIISGAGIAPGRIEEPVSVRRVFDTILEWAGAQGGESLLISMREPVLGEALKPYLQYGWQPQLMAVSGRLKVIRSGETEIYDIQSDPAESRNLFGRVDLDRELQEALGAYSARVLADPGSGSTDLSQEARERLASLGYVGSEGRASLRQDAPSPKDMVHLFRDLDVGSALFVRERYEEAIPVFRRVLEADPQNLAVCLRLAVAHSVLGDERQALELFERAKRIDPESIDLRHYLGMHYFRFSKWEQAEPLLESVLAEMPQRLPALECLAQIREEQGRIDDASRLLERIVALKSAPVGELLRLAELRMALRDTPSAIRAFERARELQGESFSRHLELGVCYLANRQLSEAATSLDRVPPPHPGYPMALFKRAQVSVLLGEPDRGERIRLAYERADATTRQLIESEPLFQGLAPR